MSDIDTNDDSNVETASHRVRKTTYRKVKAFCAARGIKLWEFIDEAMSEKLEKSLEQADA